MRMTKNTVWFLLFFFVPIASARPDTLQSDTSRTRASTPSSLHLNAKSILIQTSVSDESLDTGSALPASIIKPEMSDTNNNPHGSLPRAVHPQSNSTVQVKSGLECLASGAAAVPEVLKTKEMFADLGKYHKFMGAYGVICGALGIIAGAMLIDKADDAAYATAFITLGGISIGFGLWEINIGGKLLKYGVFGK